MGAAEPAATLRSGESSPARPRRTHACSEPPTRLPPPTLPSAPAAAAGSHPKVATGRQLPAETRSLRQEGSDLRPGRGAARRQLGEQPGASQLYRDERRRASLPRGEVIFPLFSPFLKGAAHLLPARGRVSHPSPANRLGTYWAAKFEDESYGCQGAVRRIGAEEGEVFPTGARESG